MKTTKCTIAQLHNAQTFIGLFLFVLKILLIFAAKQKE